MFAYFATENGPSYSSLPGIENTPPGKQPEKVRSNPCKFYKFSRNILLKKDFNSNTTIYTKLIPQTLFVQTVELQVRLRDTSPVYLPHVLFRLTAFRSHVGFHKFRNSTMHHVLRHSPQSRCSHFESSFAHPRSLGTRNGEGDGSRWEQKCEQNLARKKFYETY